MGETGPPVDDRRALEDLYGPLRRFAAVVGPPEVEPDDLVQEAFALALRQGPLDGYDDLGAYLRRTLVNLSSNHRRSFGRRRRALARLSDAAPPEFPHYPSDVADLFRLGPEARAVLYLAAVEGRTYAEVAEMLGITEEAARARAARGRRRLRAVLRLEV